ncbi:hypothetical protein G9A89_020208 [Geosiphon pyriformis]|nr:hypothetical protein G9A89_020208 [Geosiphon pyriformis]
MRTQIEADGEANKRLVIEKDLLGKLAIYVRYANEVYCLYLGEVSENVYFHVSVDEKNLEVVVAFGGKELDLYQYIDRKNELVKYLDVEDAKVDKIFYHNFMSTRKVVEQKILKILLSEKYKHYKVVFTGHGTGGVYAVFTALQLQPEIQDTWLEVYTYGQPRMGNAIFAEYVDNTISMIYRITLADDYVPQFPRITFKKYERDVEGYWHLETEFWINMVCDCANVNPPLPEMSYEVYKCEGYILKKFYPKHLIVEENPYCNMAKKNWNNYVGISYHYGPYFGQFMGDCRTFNKEPS